MPRIMSVRFEDTKALLPIGIAAFLLIACHSPIKSQEYFFEASADDRALRPIYTTALYTVFYDDALRRCVVHAGHTWGESGGGGGGTGIGLNAFRCDPFRIAARARDLGLKTYGNFPALQPQPQPQPQPQQQLPTSLSTPTPATRVSPAAGSSTSTTPGTRPTQAPVYTPPPSRALTTPRPATRTTSKPAPANEPVLGAPIPTIRPTIPGSETEGN